MSVYFTICTIIIPFDILKKRFQRKRYYEKNKKTIKKGKTIFILVHLFDFGHSMALYLPIKEIELLLLQYLTFAIYLS